MLPVSILNQLAIWCPRSRLASQCPGGEKQWAPGSLRAAGKTLKDVDVGVDFPFHGPCRATLNLPTPCTPSASARL